MLVADLKQILSLRIPPSWITVAGRHKDAWNENHSASGATHVVKRSGTKSWRECLMWDVELKRSILLPFITCDTLYFHIDLRCHSATSVYCI